MNEGLPVPIPGRIAGRDLRPIRVKEEHHMAKIGKAAAGALFLCMVIAACATTELTSVWRDPEYRDHPRTIMVIGALRRDDAMRLLEESFVERFQKRGIRAVAGHTVLPGHAAVDRATIVAKLKEIGADTVLVAKLVDRKEMETATTAMQMPGYPHSYYGNSWYGNYAAPAATATFEFGFVQTSVYDVQTEKLIWAATSQTPIAGPERGLLENFARKIMNELERAKVLGP